MVVSRLGPFVPNNLAAVTMSGPALHAIGHARRHPPIRMPATTDLSCCETTPEVRTAGKRQPLAARTAARDRSSPETRYRAAGSRNPPPRVILPFTGLAAGSRNPPPRVILLVAGRRDPPPRRMRPPSVVEVFMADSNLDVLSRMIQLRKR